jgi:hypothetical protein
MTLQQKLDDFKSRLESGGPPYNAPKAVIEIFHRATEELRLKTVYLQFGNKLDEFHGGAFRLSMPARYIVDQQSVSRGANHQRAGGAQAGGG